MAISYDVHNNGATAAKNKYILKVIIAWATGGRKFASHKAHHLDITKSQFTVIIYFENKSLNHQDNTVMFDITIVRILIYKTHIKK